MTWLRWLYVRVMGAWLGIILATVLTLTPYWFLEPWICPDVPAAEAQAPVLSAGWVGPGRARITWTAPGYVYRLAEGLETRLPTLSAAPDSWVLGAGGDDGYTPQTGDVYELRSPADGSVWARVTLGEEPVWFRAILPIVVIGP